MNEEKLESLIENEREWRKYLVNQVEIVKVEQIKHGKAIAALKVKSGLWGLIGGIIAIFGAYLASNVIKII